MDVHAIPNANNVPRRSVMRGGFFLVTVGALLLSAWSLFPLTAGEHLRRAFVARLAEQHPGFDISLRRVTVVPSTGVVLEGLRLAHRGAQRERYVAVERIVCESQIDFEQLLESPLQPTRIVATGVDVLAGPDKDGQWPLFLLFPESETAATCPLVEVRSGRLRLIGDSGNDLECHQIEGMLQARDGLKRFKATGTSSLAERIELTGVTDGRGSTALSFRVDQAQINREVCSRIPHLREPLQDVAAMSATVTVSGMVRWAITGQNDYAVRIAIENGQLSHAAVQRTIHDMSGSLLIRPEHLQVEFLNCRYGAAQCKVEGVVNGTGEDAELSLDLAVSQLDLHDLETLPLPAKASELYRSIQPRGTVNVEGKVGGRLADLQFTGDCQLLDVGLTPARFPYPIQNINGKLDITTGTLSGKGIVGRIGGQRAFANYHGSHSGEYRIDFRTEGPIPIDATLLSAFTPRGRPMSKTEQFLRSLGAAGSIHVVSASLARDQRGESHQEVTLDVLGGALRYKPFPYPISDIRGRITISDDQVQLSRFHGQSNDTAVIHAEGKWYREPEEGVPQLDLGLTGFAIPLDNTLRASFSPSMRARWDSLSPAGTLDRLQMRILKVAPTAEVDFTLSAQQYDSEEARRPPITLRPAQLPSAVEVVRCDLDYEDNVVKIARLDARHDNSALSTVGQCRELESGDWQLSLEILPPSRIWMDGDLLAAIPPPGREAMRSLDVRGPIGLRGTTQVTFASRPAGGSDTTTGPIAWDLLLQLEGNRLGSGEAVNHARGEMKVKGQYAKKELSMGGNIDFDSVHLFGVQVTSVEGAYAIEKGRLMVGNAVPPAGDTEAAAGSRSFSGQAFGGFLFVDGIVNLLEGERPFDVTLSLHNAALRNVLSELGAHRGPVAGYCGGTLRLIGMMNRRRNMTGRGTAYLRDAKLYQTPAMVQLLNLLQVNPNEDAAFTTGNFRYRVDGDRLAFDQIELSGGFIELHGGGTINDRKELDLAFETRVSPKSAWYHFILPLQSDRYNLYGIRVTGSLDSPELEKRALPQIEAALQNLLPTSGSTQNRGRQSSPARTPLGGRRP